MARLAFPGVMLLAAVLRLWHLDQNGFGRQYYAAGVRSMLASGHAFFYNAFDPAGFVSLDKPPLALWMQVASAKLLGFSGLAVLLPQVLEGLASVALVHHLVGRRFGRGAALVAALLFALTPIAVAVDRSNNTESCLIMVLLLAAWALVRAVETADARRLVLAFALVGVAFNVKMAAALVVVPAFALAWLRGVPALPLRQRVVALGVSALVLAAVSLAWVTAFDLTPPPSRPYAGSTRNNSMLELALLHNGVDRFASRPSRAAAATTGDAAASAAGASRAALWDRTPVGPLRLATPHLAAQMGWWLPLALAAVLARARRGNRAAVAPPRADLLLWSGWALAYAVVFSFAGGVFHTYYVAVLAPALAALAGIGASALWTRWRDGESPRALPLALLATAAWQLAVGQGSVEWRADDWRSVLLAVSVGLAAASGAALLVAARLAAAPGMRGALAAIGFAATLPLPAAWTLSTVLVRPNVATPAADIAVYGNADDDDDDATPTRPRGRRLFDYLRAQRRGERFLVAVPSAALAAPIIVRSGEPVMAMGGYLGRDPILTPDALARKVSDGELRFAILGGPAIVAPDTVLQRELARWIREHGRRVDPALWRETPGAAPAERPRRASAPMQLYDLRPDDDAVAAQR